MNLKQLQQKINELVEQGHGDAIVCIYNYDTWEYESDVGIRVGTGNFLDEYGDVVNGNIFGVV